jgi:hypothetical protein
MAPLRCIRKISITVIIFNQLQYHAEMLKATGIFLPVCLFKQTLHNMYRICRQNFPEASSSCHQLNDKI